MQRTSLRQYCVHATPFAPKKRPATCQKTGCGTKQNGYSGARNHQGKMVIVTKLRTFLKPPKFYRSIFYIFNLCIGIKSQKKTSIAPLSCIPHPWAMRYAWPSKGGWRLSCSPIMRMTVTKFTEVQ